MDLIWELPRIVKKGRERAEKILNKDYEDPIIQQMIILSDTRNRQDILIEEWINQLYSGDNLIIIEKLLKVGYREKFDLIYIDPPFLTNANYKGRIVIKTNNTEETLEYLAYRDTWEKGFIGYLEMIYIRLFLLKELLSPKGTIYVHLDYRTVHYVKILMDEIFGRENFLNEVIWAYKSGGTSDRYFSRKHDNILVYSKTKDYIFNPQLEKSYNRGLKPYRFKGVEEFQDDIGWYTLVKLKDVWQIDMVGRTSRERVGYDTQKPEKLLERIILTSSDEGSLIGDFFAGSGTTGVIAEKYDRKWIMVDKGGLSLTTINKRLIENQSQSYYICNTQESLQIEGKLFIKQVNIIKKGSKEELYIELDKYHVDVDKIEIKYKYKQKVLEILLDDSLALVDFIGIDTDYDGDIPIIRWKNWRKEDDIPIEPYIKIERDGFRLGQKIYIKTIDIFGFQSSTLLEIGSKKIMVY